MEILIIGALNARVANRDDFINDNHVVPSLMDYKDYLLDEVNVTRKSCDKNINRFGLDLIQFYKTYMNNWIKIRNETWNLREITRSAVTCMLLRGLKIEVNGWWPVNNVNFRPNN